MSGYGREADISGALAQHTCPERLLGCNSQKIGVKSQDGATAARYRSRFNTTSRNAEVASIAF